MRVFVAGLMHETSSFSPIPTVRRSFEEGIFFRPSGPELPAAAYQLIGYGSYLEAARRGGHTVVPSLCTFAEPSSPCRRDDYEALRDEILADLERALPVDAALLFMHGAQMAVGYDDCEGDLLARVRALVGPATFVGAALDLHANVSPAMLQHANVILACRHYPHTDFAERAEQLFGIAERVHRGGLRTQMVFRRVPMLGMFYTTEPRVAAVTRAAQQLESEPGMLAVSLIHGFPWADTPDVGAGVIVAAQAGCTGVEAAAERLATQFFAARDETRAMRRSIEQILDEIAALPAGPAGPCIIADAGDNPGGGAGSDSTFVLEALLRRGIRGALLGLMWDPVAVGFCQDAGVGAILRLRLGGKTAPAAGQPLDVTARVLSIRHDLRQQGIGLDIALGTAVALEIEGNVVVANTRRQQVFSPHVFTALGVDPRTAPIVVVKSSQHFYDQFAEFARAVYYCETPGTMTLHFDAGAYQRLRRPIWPIDDLRQLTEPTDAQGTA